MATISLTWDAPDPSLGGTVEGYKIFRAIGGTPSPNADGDAVVSIGTSVGTTLASTRAYTESLTDSGKHSYAVVATNPAGDSTASNAVEVEIP
jgi:hypothetical protein